MIWHIFFISRLKHVTDISVYNIMQLSQEVYEVYDLFVEYKFK